MRVLVLSPHRDDAAFSCGLTINWLVARGDALTIVNVCTISSYAPYTDAHGNVEAVTIMRRKEDEVFIEHLKAISESSDLSVDLIDLGWNDAPLRLDVEDERVQDVVELSNKEIETLAKQFAGFPPNEAILAPISLGLHVDHRLVHQAAFSAFSTEKLIFYEDLPYACRLNKLERSLADSELQRLGVSCLLPPKSGAGVKRKFGLCYPSQVAPDVADEMEDYARSLGGRERLYGSSEAFRTLGALPDNVESRQHAWENQP